MKLLLILSCVLQAGNTVHAATRLIGGQISQSYSQAWDIKVEGSIGYVAAWQGILVYNLTDTNSPVLISGWAAGYRERGFAVELLDDNLLYLIATENVYVLDRTDPSKLVLKGSGRRQDPYDEVYAAYSVFIAGNALYIGSLYAPPPGSQRYSGFLKMDITDRYNPVFVGAHSESGTTMRTAVFSEANSYIYSSNARGISIFYLPASDPFELEFRWSISADRPESPGANYADVIIVYNSGASLVLSNSHELNFFHTYLHLEYENSGYYELEGAVIDMGLDRVTNRLYVLQDNLIHVFSVGEGIQKLVETYTLRQGWGYHSLHVTSKGIFLTSHEVLFWLKPNGQLSDSHLPLPGKHLPRVHVISESLFAASISLGIDLYGGSSRRGFYPYLEPVMSLASFESHLYVAGPTEVFVIDISNLPYFNVLQRIRLPGVQNILVIKNVMYLACGSRGLEMYDIGGPMIRKIGSYNTPNDAKAVAVSGTTAYIADGDSLQVLDVCEPSSPKFLAKLDIAGARDVEVSQSGLAAYVLAAGLVVVNVNTPASPVQTAVQSLLSDVAAMAIYGDDLFVTTDSSVLIRDISTPLAPTIVGSEPADATFIGRPFLHAAHGVLLAAGYPTSTYKEKQFAWFTISPDAPASLSYDIGCFADYRALKSRRVAAYTPQQCFALCNTAGHTHAGTLFTSECWCGRGSEISRSVRTNAADCATSGHRNMAVKSSVRFSHVGCFEDNVGRTAYVSAGMSVEHCAAYCGGDTVRNYKFFGIQKGDTCWCTQDIRSKPPAASGDCNAPCIGNGEAFCGGTFRSNMYALNSMDFTVGVVTASETNAESQHTYPIEVEYWDGSVQVVGSVAAPAQGSVHVMTATGILQHPRKVRIRAQGGDGWKVHAVTMTFAGSGANWLTDGVLGKVVKNTPGSEVVEWTAPPGSS